jgi:hypothetical protein
VLQHLAPADDEEKNELNKKVLHLELRIRELEALNASLNAKYDLFICVFNLFSESYRRIAYLHRLTGKKE